MTEALTTPSRPDVTVPDTSGRYIGGTWRAVSAGDRIGVHTRGPSR